MDAARGIADQGHPLHGILVRQHEAERIVPAWAGQLERAQVVAEPLGHLA